MIDSLAHPGGNITGISDVATTLTTKRLSFLKALLPDLRKVAMLWNQDDLGMTLRYQASAKVAQQIGITVQALGVREPDDFNEAFAVMNSDMPDAILMVADALVLSTRVPREARVVDVGTGAGAPGLALAILRPDLRVTLVEPLAKRGAFLRTVLGTLSLPQVTLDGRKGAATAKQHPNAWDVALARATLPPAAWLELAAALVRDAGAAWVFLARDPSPTSGSFALAEEVPYTWPLTGAERRLARYARAATTA